MEWDGMELNVINVCLGPFIHVLNLSTRTYMYVCNYIYIDICIYIYTHEPVAMSASMCMYICVYIHV